MVHAATHLGTAVTIAVLTALPAVAQTPAAPWQSPGSAQPGTAQSQPSQLSENFDRDPVTGWHYSCPHAFIQAGNGRALATRGGGHAVWQAAGPVADFTLKFRYGYEQGAGDVFFRSTDTPRGMEFYFLRLEPRQVVLGRRLHAPGHKFPERNLASAPVLLGPRAWHDVIIRAMGGQIQVSIDGKRVLSTRDPQPLRSGACGLGAIANSGFVLYDQVTLAPLAQARADASSANVANWP